MKWLRKNALRGVLQISALACAAGFGWDLNNNLISDVWEEHYGVGPMQAEDDPDGDGFTNLAESQLGTDPFNPDSKISLELKADAACRLSLHACLAPGKRFQLESSSDLVGWQPFGPTFLTTQAESEFAVGAAIGNRRFYRCIFIGDVDEDGDGLNAWEEGLLGFRDDDADNNGLADGSSGSLVILVSILRPIRMKTAFPTSLNL